MIVKCRNKKMNTFAKYVLQRFVNKYCGEPVFFLPWPSPTAEFVWFLTTE